MEAICKNCKHFSPLTNIVIHLQHLELVRGECGKIIDGEDDSKNDCISVWDGGGYDSTVVGINFGCIHFEDKRISDIQEKLDKLEWHVNSIKDPHEE